MDSSIGSSESRSGALRKTGWDREIVRAGSHLIALWALAVVQPTLDFLSRNATDFFVIRRPAGWGFVLLLLLVAVVPPALLAAVEALAALRSATLRVRLHLFFVWGLFALLALVALKHVLAGAGAALVPAACLLGVAATAAYARFEAVRSILAVLSPAPLVVIAVFLLSSPANQLTFPGRQPDLADVRSKTPVVFVVLDELPVSSIMDRNGRIDAVRYPAFARFSRRATWFRNTITAADATAEAVPAILTGIRPAPGALPVWSDHPRNLFTLLGASHDVRAMEHATLLCPDAVCANESSVIARAADLVSALTLGYEQTVAPGRLSVNLPDGGTTWGEFFADRDLDGEVGIPDQAGPGLRLLGGPQFAQFLRMIKPWEGRDRRPPLYFMHATLPHAPWWYLPSGKRYTRELPLGLVSGVWGDDPYLVELNWQRHLLQVEFVDRLLSRLIQRLRRVGLYDRALIVVTADHGTSFVARTPRRAVNRLNAGDVGMVPLFIKAPGQRRGRVMDRPVQTIDILPTVADLLGIRLPWRVDGRSAFELSSEGRRRVHVYPVSADVQPRLFERERARTLRHQVALFGSRASRPGIFGFGPHGELVGKRPSDVRRGASRDVRAELERTGSLGSFDPNSPFAPVLVEGRLVGGSTTQMHQLAVAVNGRIAAVARTYRSGDQTRFSAVVPERALQPGRNRVEVFRISSLHGTVRLEGLGGTAGW